MGNEMAAMALVLLLHVFVMDLRRVAGVLDSSHGDIGHRKFCSNSDPIMDPNYEVRYGQDVVWQIPPNPKAVLFMAHGRGKEPLSYFDAGPRCKQCFGLPEDRATVLTALHRSYAVILVKSVGDFYQPWNVSWPPENSKDRFVVTSVIREWTKEHSLEHLPLAIFGYSSGGNFSTVLTLDLDVRSLVLMCTPGEFHVLEHATALFPPTLFVPMTRDNSFHGFYTLALETMEILRSNGVVVAEYDIYPTPLNPLFFSERIKCLDRPTSEKIYAAFKAGGWLDDSDYLALDPGFNDWRAVLLKADAVTTCQLEKDLCFALDIAQELNMAYAFHSLTSLADDVVYNWFDFTLFGRSSSFTGTTASL